MNHFLRLLMLFISLHTFSLSAQSGKITGTVISSEQKSIDGVLVSLLEANTKALIKTEITDYDGTFSFESLSIKDYIIVIEDIAYKTFESEPISLTTQNLSSAVKQIILTPSEIINLEGAIVTRNRKIIERKLDKTVINVDAMLSSAGSDAMEILEKLPGITVDQNGTITFKGKSGVNVFVDDKPTYLSGSQLEAYLKSLPAEMLSQIELMTNPPAKYEAAGNAGVINIKTKRSKVKGFNGNFSTRLSQGQATHTRNGLNLNYRNDKFRLYGNLNYASQESLSELYIFRDYKNEDGTTKTLFHQNTNINQAVNTSNGRIGMDYYQSEKTTWGISLSGLNKSGTDKTAGRSELTNAATILDSTIVADNREKN